VIKEIRKRMMVWDSPIFFTHWLLALCFLGAILTQESEKFRLVHVTMGYTMLGIVGFRVIWGFIGSKYARFTTIKPRFLRVRENIQAIFRGDKEFSIGLNALGFIAAYLLMGLVLLVSASGYLVFNEIGPELISEVHELVGNLLIAVVVVHVGSIVLNAMYQRLQKTNAEVAKSVGVLVQRARPYKWVTIIILSVVVYFWGIQLKIW
jgi:cytochrome b